jgi:branched-chain amino acid transport system permease protein
MWRRLFLAIFLSLLLPGCAIDVQQAEICRQIFTTLAGGSVPVPAPDSDGAGIVELHGTGASLGRHLVCRFGGPPLTRHHLDLMAVELDGTALPDTSLIMLRHVLGLATPGALLAPPALPMPPGLMTAYLVQQIINGLSIGAMLALVATGFSLVYGITGTIQFAYGEICMIGAFLFVIPFLGLLAIGVTNLTLILLLALPCTVAATAIYGWAMGRLIYRPMRGSGQLNALIAAIGLAIALREYVRLTQGTQSKWLPAVLHRPIELFEAGGFGVFLGQTQIVILAVATMLALGLAYLLTRTRWGRSYRACADDGAMAALLGVDLQATIVGTLVLGAALAALAGACFTIQYGEADPYMGFIMGMKALTAVVLGGFGTVTGALVGGLAVGLFEALWAGYFGSAYKDAAVFSLLAIVLVFRPEGLLGRGIAPGLISRPASSGRV